MDKDKLITLCEKVAPVLRFHPDEKYYPISVETYLKHSTLKTSNGSVNHPSLDQLPSGSKTNSTTYLQLNNDGWNKGCDLQNAKVYATAREMNSQSGKEYFDIQYWIFYGYDGDEWAQVKRVGTSGTWQLEGMGHHQGDWEHVTVRCNGAGSIAGYYTSRHGEGAWTVINDMTRESYLDVNGKPIVYVALDSHANYSRSGIHNSFSVPLGVAEFDIVDICKKSGKEWSCADNLELLGTTPIGNGNLPNIQAPEWFFYNGLWGPSETQHINSDAFGVTVANIYSAIASLSVYTFFLPALTFAWNSVAAVVTPLVIKMLKHDASGPSTPGLKNSYRNGDPGIWDPQFFWGQEKVNESGCINRAGTMITTSREKNSGSGPVEDKNIHMILTSYTPESDNLVAETYEMHDYSRLVAITRDTKTGSYRESSNIILVSYPNHQPYEGYPPYGFSWLYVPTPDISDLAVTNVNGLNTAIFFGKSVSGVTYIYGKLLTHQYADGSIQVHHRYISATPPSRPDNYPPNFVNPADYADVALASQKPDATGKIYISACIPHDGRCVVLFQSGLGEDLEYAVCTIQTHPGNPADWPNNQAHDLDYILTIIPGSSRTLFSGESSSTGVACDSDGKRVYAVWGNQSGVLMFSFAEGLKQIDDEDDKQDDTLVWSKPKEIRANGKSWKTNRRPSVVVKDGRVNCVFYDDNKKKTYFLNKDIEGLNVDEEWNVEYEFQVKHTLDDFNVTDGRDDGLLATIFTHKSLYSDQIMC